VACIQVVALYGSELWWDPKDVGRQDNLQLFLNRQARFILRALPTTPRGTLMRESGLRPAPVDLDSRQQRVAARLADMGSGKLKELHLNPSSGAPICRVLKEEHEHGPTTEGIMWPAPGEESVVRTIILDDTTAARRTVQRWAREKEPKIAAGFWMCWTHGSRSDNGRVGAPAVCKHGDQWRSCRSFLGIGRMEVFDAELWAFGLALGETIEKRETLQKRGVKTVAIYSDSQAAIRRAPHLESGLGHGLVRQIDQRARALLAHCIATKIN